MASYSDILFGKIALQNRLVTAAQLQQALAEAPPGRTLSDVLVARGLITREQAQRVQRAQALSQFVRAERIYAKIALERRLAPLQLLKDCFTRQEQLQHNVRIGQLLVERRAITPAQNDELVEEQLVRLAEETSRIEEAGLAADLDEPAGSLGDVAKAATDLDGSVLRRAVGPRGLLEAPPPPAAMPAMPPALPSMPGRPGSTPAAQPPGARSPSPAPRGSAPPAQPATGPAGDLRGRTIASRYRVLEKIGEGGMGTVWKAEHCLMEKVVALKVLHANLVSSKQSLERFRREIRAASKFQHKHVIQIYDAGEGEGGLFYMAMEYAQGEGLEDRIQRLGRLPLDMTVELMRQTLAAVGEAHKKGIVHRDLKSGNIIIVKGKEGEDVVKVMDFGIAKIALESSDGAVGEGGLYKTQEGVVTGTPQYMSPEQCSGEPVDGRADLYSLGVILFEMLAGELPFKSNTPMGFLGKHIVEPPPPITSVRPEVPRGLEAVIARLLEKRPADRYQSADEVLAALDGRASAAARPAPEPPRPGGDLMRTMDVEGPSPVFASAMPAGSVPILSTPGSGVLASDPLVSSPGAALASAGRTIEVAVPDVGPTVEALPPGFVPPPPRSSAPVVVVVVGGLLLLLAVVAAAVAVVVGSGPGDGSGSTEVASPSEPPPPTETSRPPPPTETSKPPPPPTETSKPPPPPPTETSKSPPPPPTETSKPPPPPPPTETSKPPPEDRIAQGRAVLGQLRAAILAGKLAEADALKTKAAELLPQGHTDLEMASLHLRAAHAAADARAARAKGELTEAKRLLEAALKDHPDRQVQTDLRAELAEVETDIKRKAERAQGEAALDAALARSLKAALDLDLAAADAALTEARAAAKRLGAEGLVQGRAASLAALKGLAGELRAARDALAPLLREPAPADATPAKLQAAAARLEEQRPKLKPLEADQALAAGLAERLDADLARARARQKALEAAQPPAVDPRLARFRHLHEGAREVLEGPETAKVVATRLEKMLQLKDHPAYSARLITDEERRFVDTNLARATARKLVWDELGPGIVAVPGGPWKAPSGIEHQLPAGLFAGETEVTCVEWDEFCKATNRARPQQFAAGRKEPVRMISLADAEAYCAWRNRGKRRVQFRLPTEVEWERAARGRDGKREFPWGDAFEEWREEFAAIAGKHETVGSFPKDRNDLGLWDLVGNVSEMTSSRRDGKLVVKGGSMSSERSRSGASSAQLVKPGDEVSPTIGLRLFAVEKAN